MRYHCDCYESIPQIEPSLWNALRGPSDPYMDLRFLRVVERAMAERVRLGYVLVRDESGRPMASACHYTFRLDPTMLLVEPQQAIARRVMRLVPFLRVRLLFCGLPVPAGQSHLRLAPEADRAEALRVLDGCWRQVARRARARCIVLKDFTAAECAQLEPLETLGYQQAASPPMNYARPGFTSFDDYCDSLPARKRYPIQRSRRKFAGSGLQVVHLRGGECRGRLNVEEIYRHYDAVASRHARLEHLSERFFQGLAEEMPEEVVFTLICDGPRLLAAATSLLSGGFFQQLFVGFNYDENAQHDLYFNLFYQALDYAWQQGAAPIALGQSSDTFKVRKLGAYQEPRFFYARGLRRLGSWIIRHGAEKFFPIQPQALPSV